VQQQANMANKNMEAPRPMSISGNELIRYGERSMYFSSLNSIQRPNEKKKSPLICNKVALAQSQIFPLTADHGLKLEMKKNIKLNFKDAKRCL